MANMLIRTRQLRCKARGAVILRVIFFFGIPTLYFLYSRGIVSEAPLKSETTHLDLGTEDRYWYTDGNVGTRRLLGLVSKEGRNCTPAAILEFPPDGFTRSQRQHGFIVVHCVLAVYCFLLLGSVCEQYFVPAIEIICERLNMASDIAGATFMAAASSSPELFINCVGTFVTEGDLGVGAIVGSAVFNVLAVPACCALFSGMVIELDWWSVSRDCLMYAVAVVALILSLLDDRIYWHEALLLVLMYTLYILAMVFNGRLGSFFKSSCCSFQKPKMYTEVTPLLIKEKTSQLDAAGRMTRPDPDTNTNQLHESTDSDDSASSVWSWPDEKTSGAKKFLWVLTWPISLVLWLTVPDCRRHQRLYPLTFVMCVAWIGGVSYLVAWIITVIGDTLNVPDSITGLTILAAGTSLPEAVSSVLVTNHGHGNMGISNSIGSNTFDILLCLGLPWLIKSLFYPSTPGNHWVSINSSGLSYSALSLLSTLLTLYGALVLNKFQLDWKVGGTCALVYVGFLVLASLIELNVLFQVNLPICPH
ncbi:sodium/potassium/calcium exchanger 3-like [Pectinophora gossypiella]|uniref:sodium/potassium/calcium exchanger 3-like n=1 Tax=Pectinophora gossypiella TaxID=13191 RepID=UPI00214E4BE6|nr:sodium/potassium/calcium exchanger 3-like [Pectinophora gossypiella]